MARRVEQREEGGVLARVWKIEFKDWWRKEGQRDDVRTVARDAKPGRAAPAGRRPIAPAGVVLPILAPSSLVQCLEGIVSGDGLRAASVLYVWELGGAMRPAPSLEAFTVALDVRAAILQLGGARGLDDGLPIEAERGEEEAHSECNCAVPCLAEQCEGRRASLCDSVRLLIDVTPQLHAQQVLYYVVL